MSQDSKTKFKVPSAEPTSVTSSQAPKPTAAYPVNEVSSQRNSSTGSEDWFAAQVHKEKASKPVPKAATAATAVAPTTANPGNSLFAALCTCLKPKS